MWRELVEWAWRYLFQPECDSADPADIDIPRFVDPRPEATALIRRRKD